MDAQICHLIFSFLIFLLLIETKLPDNENRSIVNGRFRSFQWPICCIYLLFFFEIGFFLYFLRNENPKKILMMTIRLRSGSSLGVLWWFLELEFFLFLFSYLRRALFSAVYYLGVSPCNIFLFSCLLCNHHDHHSSSAGHRFDTGYQNTKINEYHLIYVVFL
jgi:hypothetical protein